MIRPLEKGDLTAVAVEFRSLFRDKIRSDLPTVFVSLDEAEVVTAAAGVKYRRTQHTAQIELYFGSHDALVDVVGVTVYQLALEGRRRIESLIPECSPRFDEFCRALLNAGFIFEGRCDLWETDLDAVHFYSLLVHRDVLPSVSSVYSLVNNDVVESYYRKNLELCLRQSDGESVCSRLRAIHDMLRTVACVSLIESDDRKVLIET